MNRIERVIVAHNPVGAGADASTRDVLAQVELVGEALDALGIRWTPLSTTRRAVCRRLPAGPGTLIFNLVEAPPGDPAVHPATAAVFELLGLPFTGSPAGTLWATTDKLVTRALLAAAGLPLAAGGALEPEGAELGLAGGARTAGSRQLPATAAGGDLFARVPPPWIVKPACEDASLGLEGGALCESPEAALARAAALARRFPGERLLVEHFLPGRELNVSLLALPDERGLGLAALPVAEIVFEGWPAALPRIVGYEAKWEPDSFAYRHTVRRFPDAAEDRPLLARARDLALAAARVCGVSGYGRVDLRLDEDGEPRVLEVNANPCLAADAGFMAAAAHAGISPAEVVSRILAAALRDHRGTAAASRLAAGAHRATSLAAEGAVAAQRFGGTGSGFAIPSQPATR